MQRRDGADNGDVDTAEDGDGTDDDDNDDVYLHADNSDRFQEKL